MCASTVDAGLGQVGKESDRPNFDASTLRLADGRIEEG